MFFFFFLQTCVVCVCFKAVTFATVSFGAIRPADNTRDFARGHLKENAMIAFFIIISVK